MAEEVKRPSRTSLEGMIWNANHVLEQALLPSTSGIPQAYFKSCVGVVLISVVEVGFIFSGNVGTGILLKKQSHGSWSPPVACGMTGIGWGFLVGGSVKDVMIFIFDETIMDKIGFDKLGLKVGAQGEATIGPLGRAHEANITLSDQGVGTTVSVAYTKGAFVGLSIEGSIIGARPKANDIFYGKPVESNGILNCKVTVPADKVTMLDEVYKKLKLLSEGATAEPDEAEAKKKEAAAAAAEEAKEQVHKEEDVVEVYAKVEAEKEEATKSDS